jgi:Flp pilus assembly protein TadG
MRPRGAPRHAGMAVVEFAVCLPILVLVVFGSIEACNAIYLKQAATASAYEAVRVATGTGGTQVAGRTRGEEILAARSIQNATLTFTPADEALWNRGTPVSVQVSVPATNNLGGISMFFHGKNMQSAIVMVKQ